MKLIAFTLAISSAVACVTMDGSQQDKKAPKITKDLSIDEAIHIAVTWGEKSLDQFGTYLKMTGTERSSQTHVEEYLLRRALRAGGPTLVRTVRLYQSYRPRTAPKIFRKLIEKETPLTDMLAWEMAGKLASETMKIEIDALLSKAIEDGDEVKYMTPEAARAIAKNQAKDLYTFLRAGLNNTHHEAFVEAMIQLRPAIASKDFLDYLAQAPIEELRQMNMSSLNVLACTRILAHMRTYPPSISHRHFDHLVLFAISRNNSLRELANEVIDAYLPRHQETIALKISRLPTWIQVAYVDMSRHNRTIGIKLLLAKIRKISSQEDVVEQLSNELR